MNQSFFINYYTCPHCKQHFEQRGAPLGAALCPLCASFSVALFADEYDEGLQILAVRAGVHVHQDIALHEGENCYSEIGHQWAFADAEGTLCLEDLQPDEEI